MPVICGAMNERDVEDLHEYEPRAVMFGSKFAGASQSQSSVLSAYRFAPLFSFMPGTDMCSESSVTGVVDFDVMHVRA